MSFLDNLENSLKSLESADERAANKETQEQRDAERAQALTVAPWVEQLKASPFTQALMEEATRAGHKTRSKVRILWLGSTLRLESRERKLELRPTPDGILAVFVQHGPEARSEPINLSSASPEDLIRRWLD
ncbi:MAG: hypothetical protein M3Z32_09260 [Acidobacteriota bacterium]|nr:hypothetical protein [Acidobacteriota bacterium]